MSSLTKDGILTADDLRREALEIPEWGGTVYVRVLTAKEKDRFESDWLAGGKGNYENFRARLAVLCLVDGAGQRLFADIDAQALGEKSGVALDRVFDVARKLNRLGKDDIDELVKN